MRVKVHPHRTKYKAGISECVSVTPDHKGGHVYYTHFISLRDVSFRVHQSGFKRMQETGRRNVHAWMVGYTKEKPSILVESRTLTEVWYDYKTGRFRFEDETDVTDRKFLSGIVWGNRTFVHNV